jgi:hypothetical protein
MHRLIYAESSDQKLLEKYMVLVFCEGLYLNTIKYVIVSYATEGPLLEESLRIIIFSLGICLHDLPSLWSKYTRSLLLNIVATSCSETSLE